MYLVVYGMSNAGLATAIAGPPERSAEGGIWGAAFGTGILPAVLSSGNMPTVLVGALSIDATSASGPVRDAMIYANVIGCDLGPKITQSVFSRPFCGCMCWDRRVKIGWGYYSRRHHADDADPAGDPGSARLVESRMKPFLVYPLAALFEIAGCCILGLVAAGEEPSGSAWDGVVVPLRLAADLVPTDAAGRAFAAYGGARVAASLLWLWIVEGTTPDRWDFIGGAVVLPAPPSSC